VKITIRDIKLPTGIFTKLFLAYWGMSILLLFFTNQGDIVLYINSISLPALDYPMKILDYLGHGVFALIFFLVVLFFRVDYGMLCFYSFSLVILLTNLLKRIVFLQHHRPLWYLFYDDFDRFISIAPINYLRSFPSGHSMTAFAIATILSYWFRNKYLQITFFCMALIVSLARIYLFQHFFVDTLWGALFGVLSSIIAKLIYDKILWKTDKSRLQVSLFRFLQNWYKK
jgi:membrane-associated phospholipid phosphatase